MIQQISLSKPPTSNSRTLSWSTCGWVLGLLLGFGATTLGAQQEPAAQEEATAAPDAKPEPSVPGPSFEDVIDLRRAGGARISPDGSHVAFTLRTTDWENNRFDTEIWLAPSDGATPFQLTRTEDGSSGNATWSPDSQWLAFQARRGGEGQLHLIHVSGGEAFALTSVDGGIGDFAFSPDGKRLAYTRADDDEAREAQSKKYGDFAIEDQEYRLSHLWLQDLPPRLAASPEAAACDLPEPVRLTGGEFHIGDFDWSPDGTRIAVQRADNPTILGYVTTDIGVLDVPALTAPVPCRQEDKPEDGDSESESESESEADLPQLRMVVERPGVDGVPMWLPDGERLLFFTANGNTTSNFYVNEQLGLVTVGADTETAGAPRIIPVQLDENPQGVTVTPAGVFFTAYQGTRRGLYELDVDNGAVAALSTARPDLRIHGFTTSKDGEIMALSVQTPDAMQEIYRLDVTQAQAGTFEPVRVTHTNHQLEGWTLGQAEVIQWTSHDGATIEGVLHKPADWQAGEARPLMVIIHGGPAAISLPGPTPGYVYPALQWLAKGALVLEPNYRGSTGYGADFRALNVRNLGVGDAWDVLSGVDHLVELGLADPERLGAMGWSQGGYISAFLTTTSGRFRAISVGAGISDWETYYVNTDIHPFTRQYLKANPWDDPEIYAKTSPMTYIQQATTPTLIQHGENDQRVPIPNAYKLYQGLQDQGVDVRLVVYQDFGHGISRPKEQLAALWHNWQWFARYVWGEEVDLP